MCLFLPGKKSYNNWVSLEVHYRVIFSWKICPRFKNIGIKFAWWTHVYHFRSVCSLLSILWTGPKVIENNLYLGKYFLVQGDNARHVQIARWAHCQRQVAF